MDILKAAVVFEKLAQRVVNLPPQFVLPDQPVVGSSVSEQQVKELVTNAMLGLAQAYKDPAFKYMDSVVLQPDNSFSIDVRVSSNTVEPHQLALEIKQQLQSYLKRALKNSVLNISVAPLV